MKTKKAFTMIELIFVIVILGILAGVAVPKLLATRDDAEIASSLHDINVAIGDFGAYHASQASFTTISQMTSVTKFDKLNLDLSHGINTVNFQTRVEGEKENCIAFEFNNSGGKLKIIGNTSANGAVCKGVLNSPSFKSLSGSYVLGGLSVVY